MSQETKEALKISRHNLHTIHKNINVYNNYKNFSIGTWDIYPFEVQHDVHNLGYVLVSLLSGERIVFFTDTCYVKNKFPCITHWIVECNYIKEKLDKNLYDNETSIYLRNRIVKSHMSLETLKDIFKANDLSQTKEVWLTHLSDSNSDAKIMKEEIQKATGKVIKVC